MEINGENLRDRITKYPPEKPNWVMKLTGWRKVSFLLLKSIIRHDIQVSPNFITSISLFAGLLMFVVAFSDSYIIRLLAIPLFYIAGLLDHLDGDLARATGKTSSIGHWFDSLGFTLAKTYLIVFPLFKVLQIQSSMFLYVLGILQISVLYFYDEAKNSFQQSVIDKRAANDKVCNINKTGREYKIFGMLRFIDRITTRLFIIDSRMLIYLLCVILDNYFAYFWFNILWCVYMVIKLINTVHGETRLKRKYQKV